MKVLILGHTGLEKIPFLEKVRKLAEGQGKFLEIYDLETQTQSLCGANSPFHLDQYFTKKDEFIKNRAEALELIIEKERKENPRNCVLNVHATYRRRLTPFHVLHYELLAEFRPDMLITLIDDVYRVQARIKRKAETIADIPTAKITLKDIMEWRSDEIMIAESIATFLSSSFGRPLPHYIVPLRGGERVVYQLMFESREALNGQAGWKPKAYIGFPITKAYSDESLRKEREEFRKRMKELDLIVFDPYAIEERKLVSSLEKALKQQPPPDYIEVVSEDGERFKVDTKEAQMVSEDIKVQVAIRDYKLIHQSDFFAGYRPAHSSGERSEIQYANQLGRPVYVVWPPDDPPADDFKNLAINDRKDDLDSFIELIRQKVIPFFTQTK